MLGWWAELMPLCVVRWIAARYCEKLELAEVQTFAMPRPGALVVLPTPEPEWKTRLYRMKHPDAIAQRKEPPKRPGCKKTTGCVCERENLGEQCIWRM